MELGVRISGFRKQYELNCMLKNIENSTSMEKLCRKMKKKKYSGYWVSENLIIRNLTPSLTRRSLKYYTRSPPLEWIEKKIPIRHFLYRNSMIGNFWNQFFSWKLQIKEAKAILFLHFVFLISSSRLHSLKRKKSKRWSININVL